MRHRVSPTREATQTHAVGPQPLTLVLDDFKKKGAEYLTALWIVMAGRMMEARP